jgi:hypothetical protein
MRSRSALEQLSWGLRMLVLCTLLPLVSLGEMSTSLYKRNSKLHEVEVVIYCVINECADGADVLTWSLEVLLCQLLRTLGESYVVIWGIVRRRPHMLLDSDRDVPKLWIRTEMSLN